MTVISAPTNATIARVTDRIRKRSESRRAEYLARMYEAVANGPARAHLACGNQAHAYAAMGAQKPLLAEGRVPNIGIVTAYNDMLSAHQPFETFPARIKAALQGVGATAQVAGGVPAMCDGVTQGQTGMELSLFSRDVIALAAGVALSHNCFDAALYLGVCDKIVPGLVIAAATFGHIPAVFVPAGPMTSGLPNDEKAKVRNQYAAGEIGRDKLMEAEMASYHGPGTCTFYGTANSNQMLMEIMGLHLPGASFINPNTPLRDALTEQAARRAAEITALGNDFRPTGEILDERAFVNGIVGLMATGGSTNLVLHLPAMARAAGIVLDIEDFHDISAVVPLMAKVYPNGLADVNHFHAAGGMQFLIRELLRAGLLNADAKTVAGDGLAAYVTEPKLIDGHLTWVDGPEESLNDKILRPAVTAFQPQGGLRQLSGNLGRGVIKISAVAPEYHVIEAPVRVFADQEEVKEAFKRDEFTSDTVVVVRFQGPQANGMPELHSLTPVLSVLLGRGLKVALVTDGRMSGASGKVPAAIHVSPEAAAGGPIARLRDGDIVRLDAEKGELTCLAPGFAERAPVTADLSKNEHGIGRELFAAFRRNVGAATEGAAVVV
ncbi:phosphogluconate dehydratase [Paenirhodobacter populi]|uniref:Phosphogluconate dehydratase n=1 Tax=Paenirhodobacter populi TaxID=2306993 RepID=A0A443JQ31_9RHOB|nr:phosphogluconate dehydratase [Sinirhodobacter populi]RWR08659.1 phosphogluconate dehydratase [Sinirhodobacter populi]RWR12808.1 phosphogluconate dehydratase [Sinirhodobacter populi]RWR22621.1 phosphogluconate dehydratase [Sinirhodobacter populi]RWR29925.1 phosphogluconate dehydratase [Sinirhodobacter populi]RWR31695.1 phosphogluconate dehydratase [Sinirhodobacter populi]